MMIGARVMWMLGIGMILQCALTPELSAQQGSGRSLTDSGKKRPSHGRLPAGATFAVSVSRDTVYAGGYTIYTGTLRLAANPAPRFLEPPIYVPPQIAGGSVRASRIDSLRHRGTGDLPTAVEYRYRHTIFPLTSGIDTLTALLNFTAVNEADPYESAPTTLEAPPHILVVRPLPLAGRPNDFSGAVGQFTATLPTDTIEWRVGIGVVLRARIAGTGNLALIARPPLTLSWASVAPISDSIAWDSTTAIPRGVREFSWLVTPQDGDTATIPSIRYSYFDPDAQQYKVTETGVVAVRVTGQSVPPHAASPTTPIPILEQLLRRYRVAIGVVVGVLAIGVAALGWFTARSRA